MSTAQTTSKTVAAVGSVAQWTEDRTGASKAVREFGRKIFPSHWSFMLGEVALYSFIILVLSGTFHTFWIWFNIRGIEQ
jgi:ubiquinol-cytochrome c reductase cytochrome b subunit